MNQSLRCKANARRQAEAVPGATAHNAARAQRTAIAILHALKPYFSPNVALPRLVACGGVYYYIVVVNDASNIIVYCTDENALEQVCQSKALERRGADVKPFSPTLHQLVFRR